MSPGHGNSGNSKFLDAGKMLKNLWDDWIPNILFVLRHEHGSGYAK
jgi:hypothetical protein